jgi:hypothetical protein
VAEGTLRTTALRPRPLADRLAHRIRRPPRTRSLEPQRCSRGEADDIPLQWSPDGSIIAIAIYVYTDSPRAIDNQYHLHLIQASTGNHIADLIDLQLVGSASFSPDGRRLLVSGEQGVSVYDIYTESLEHLAAIPKPGEPRPGTLRILGLVDDERLLTAVQRGRTMTIGTTTYDGTDQHPLIRWTGELDMYPVVASMPSGFWA